MTRAAALLADLGRYGAKAYRVGNRVRIRPAYNVPASLLRALRKHKGDLLSLLATDMAPETSGQWQVIVERCRPSRYPVRFDSTTTITNPRLCIERVLGDLESTVLRLNAGRDAVLAELLDAQLQILKVCGCDVRVERLS